MIFRRTVLSVLCAVLTSAAFATRAAGGASGEECPLPWHLSLDKAIEEAKGKDRPIVLVFPEGGANAHVWFNSSYVDTQGRKVWTAVSTIKAANVVLCKVAPPGNFQMPAGASAEMTAKLRDAQAKLQERYNVLIRKYGVSRIPTVIFLSPDGETILRSYTRMSEDTVLRGMRHLQHYFYHYRLVRAILDKKDLAEVPSKEGGGELSPIHWYLSLQEGAADAKKRNRPIVLVFEETGATSFEWFGATQSKVSEQLLFTSMKYIAAADVVLVKVGPTSQLLMSSTASGQQTQDLLNALRKLSEEYQALGRKFGVARTPAVFFLAPDGATILKSFQGSSEETVIKGLDQLPRMIEQYNQMQEMLKAAGS